MANHALAVFLARSGADVHLVAHRVADDLREFPNVRTHIVAKPLGSYLLGAPFLDYAGRRHAAEITARGGRVVVNGGNCQWNDVNWVHYVHAAYTPPVAVTGFRKLKWTAARRLFLDQERRALRQAAVAITNSKRTSADVVTELNVDERRVRTVYYGIDADRFAATSDHRRAQARVGLGLLPDRPIVAFVGALGDRRKGFDILYSAWVALCADPQWDADLLVVGAGDELGSWKERAATAGVSSRIRFLGFRRDVPSILAASDAMVHPAHYEAFGLGVQEALASGLPALVSESAGVAERYPEELRDLLLPHPISPDGLAASLRRWRESMDVYRERVRPLTAAIRARSWDAMGQEILDVIASSPRRLPASGPV